MPHGLSVYYRPRRHQRGPAPRTRRGGRGASPAGTSPEPSGYTHKPRRWRDDHPLSKLRLVEHGGGGAVHRLRGGPVQRGRAAAGGPDRPGGYAAAAEQPGADDHSLDLTRRDDGRRGPDAPAA